MKQKKAIATAVILVLVGLKLGYRVYRQSKPVSSPSTYATELPQDLAPAKGSPHKVSSAQLLGTQTIASATNQAATHRQDASQSFAALYHKQVQINKKVVLNEAEKQFLHSLANDPEYREKLFLIFKVDSKSTFSSETEATRIEAISLVMALFQQAGKTGKALLAQKALEVVKNPAFKEIADKNLQKSVLGDKADMIALLRRFAPLDYENLREEIKITQNKWLSYLLTYSAQHS